MGEKEAPMLEAGSLDGLAFLMGTASLPVQVRRDACNCASLLVQPSDLPECLDIAWRRCLQDEHWDVRQAAVVMLHKMKMADGLPVLKGFLASRDWHDRRAALKTLGVWVASADENVLLLESIIAEAIIFVRDANWHVRRATL